MSKLNQLLSVFAIILGIAFFSCKKNRGDNVTSITLSSDVNQADAGLGEIFIFEVIGNSGKDCTTSSVFLIDDTIRSSNNTFMPEDAGTIVVTATYNDITSEPITVTAINTLTDITIKCRDVVLAGDTIGFELENNYGDDVTKDAEFYVNKTLISSENIYTTSEAEYISVYAKYKKLTSDTIIIDVIDPTHTPKILVEDYLATWCWNCPELVYKIVEAEANNSNIIPVAIHDDQEMGYEYVKEMENTFNIAGLPTLKINRIHDPVNEEYEFTTFLENSVGLGLGISSIKIGNDIDITVKVRFDLNYFEELKLVVYLLEDNLIYDQVNTTEYFGGSNPIVDFEHDNVLRQSLTDVMGDVIENSQTIPGNIYSKVFNITVPDNVENANNLKLVAFVVNRSSNEVINAQSVAVGANQDFD